MSYFQPLNGMIQSTAPSTASISAESRREKFVSEAEEMAASWPSCIPMYFTLPA